VNAADLPRRRFLHLERNPISLTHIRRV
jgi:hypothetical protein